MGTPVRWIGRRKRVKAAETVVRARTYPSGDYRRWKILSELEDVDAEIAFSEALALAGAEDPESMTLAAEILDGVFTRGHTRPELVRQGEELLSAMCRLDQNPEVLAAALHPYAMVSSVQTPFLLELLSHPDARVRRSATQLIAVSQEGSADDDLVALLIRLLAADPDSTVRQEAARGLELIFDCDDAWKPRIADAFAGHQGDPVPGIRLSAIRTITAADPGRTLEMLTDELFGWEVDWQFVSACEGGHRWIAVPRDIRVKAHQALLRLRKQGWAKRETPSQYPLADERAEILANAIAAVRSR
ncbi:HEAT repeat domain-containing protein [Streptacidiphilus fuscans]|uniref:HEAT repeat domain-containing protein n=1 Tax=Streptacidiphilus fuscans TaxID=2789292 RepID=A0A931B0F8_9ACTN|nr:HEAT repeat domain-containing protein [Streptacidiphilus fuscans]MBF9066417.1 HEAT repeat domain-containing protein [Streptacidiphilus fuscans]